MRLKWVPIAMHALLFVLLFSLSAVPTSLYLYVISLLFFAAGINFERAGLIYVSSAAALLALIPLAAYQVQEPIIALLYSFLTLVSMELALEGMGTGYLAVEWKKGSMRNWLLSGHVAFLVAVLGVSAFLVQSFLFFRLITNDFLLLLILAVLSMGGIAFFVRLYSRELVD